MQVHSLIRVDKLDTRRAPVMDQSDLKGIYKNQSSLQHQLGLLIYEIIVCV